MHEFSICRGLLDQLGRVAAANGASEVVGVTLSVGPLSGVEIPLLERAFVAARAGTIAEHADLVIERTEVRVRCRSCGAETSASANKLMCGGCGAHEVTLSGGGELLLKSVELVARPAADRVLEDRAHV